MNSPTGSSTANYDEHLERIRISEDKVDEDFNLRPDTSPFVRFSSLFCNTQTLSANTSGKLTVSTPPSRGIKRGYKNFVSPQPCGVSIHDDPVWLWSLRPKEWSSICILQGELERLCSQHPACHMGMLSKYL